MKRHFEDGRLWLSAEPCHYGMIEMPRHAAKAMVANDIDNRLRSYSKRFEPLPMRALGQSEVDVIA